MKKVLLCSALLLALPAHAEWVEVSSTKLNTTYIDPATIKKTGPVRRAWQRDEWPEKPGRPFRSGRELKDFHCDEEKSRVIQRTVFSEPSFTGELLFSSTGSSGLDTNWVFAEPGTSEAAILRFVCSQ
jgi:hypothetical protein